MNYHEQSLSSIHRVLREVWARELSADEGLAFIEGLLCGMRIVPSYPTPKIRRKMQDALDSHGANPDAEDENGVRIRWQDVVYRSMLRVEYEMPPNSEINE